MHVLRADGDVRARSDRDGRLQVDEGNAYRNIVALVPGDERKEFLKECGGLLGRFVHLPVAGNQFFARHVGFRSPQISEVCNLRLPAACEKCWRVATSYNTKRTSRTYCVVCSASSALLSATGAASSTGYPKMPVEIAGKATDAICN